MSQPTGVLKKILLLGSVFVLLLVSLIPSIGYAEERCTYDRGGIEHCSETVDGVTTTTTHYGDDVEHVQTSTPAPDLFGIIGNVALAGILMPIAVIAFVILTIASFLLFLAGMLFNWSVVHLVFGFATLFGNSPGLLLAWKILRDFGNITLLFGFVYMGICTILDISSYSVKKALPNLIIFAVLLNFSLFVSEAIIDTTNVLASTLWTSTFEGSCSGNLQNCATNTGLAGSIIQQTGITSLFQSNQGATFINGIQDIGRYVGNPIGETIKSFAFALMVTTAAVVLFAGAFMLLSRAIFLVFLMVVSPIGFAGMAVPPLQKIANDWWKHMMDQALFAPVFLLLLFVALKITEGLGALQSSGGSLGSAITDGKSADAGPILLFALVIGFMIAALLVAKQFGIYGAEVVTKNALGVIKGAASFPFTPYRDMAGAGAKHVAQKYSAFAGARLAGFKTWKPTGLIGKTAKAVVGGTAGAVDDTVMGGLGGLQTIKVGSRTYTDQQKHQKERGKEMEEAQHEAAKRKELGDNFEAWKKAEEANRPQAEIDAAKEKYERTVQETSTEDIKKYLEKSEVGIEGMAEALSPDKFSELINDKDFASGKKEKLMDKRFKKLIAAVEDINMSDDDRRKEVRKWSSKDTEVLAKKNPVAFKKLMENVDGNEMNFYSDDQYEALSKSSALTNSQKEHAKQNNVVGRMDNALKSASASGTALSPTQKNIVKGMKARQKSRLSNDALKKAVDEALLNPGDFGEIQSRGEISEDAKQHVARHIDGVVRGTIPATAEVKKAYQKYIRGVAGSYWIP